jgi:hypothetical protein
LTVVTITKESVNADVLIDFMKRLIKDTGRKVLLILDNLRVHHTKKGGGMDGRTPTGN